MANNSVNLDMNLRTQDKVRVGIRVNAIFIQAKLIAAGLSAQDAKAAVEKLYKDGFGQGYEDGRDSGYEDGYDAANESSRTDEFNK